MENIERRKCEPGEVALRILSDLSYQKAVFQTLPTSPIIVAHQPQHYTHTYYIIHTIPIHHGDGTIFCCWWAPLISTSNFSTLYLHNPLQYDHHSFTAALVRFSSTQLHHWITADDLSSQPKKKKKKKKRRKRKSKKSTRKTLLSSHSSTFPSPEQRCFVGGEDVTVSHTVILSLILLLFHVCVFIALQPKPTLLFLGYGLWHGALTRDRLAPRHVALRAVTSPLFSSSCTFSYTKIRLRTLLALARRRRCRYLRESTLPHSFTTTVPSAKACVRT